MLVKVEISVDEDEAGLDNISLDCSNSQVLVLFLFVYLYCSVVDPNTLNLDAGPIFCPNLDPDSGNS